ncbi:MAG: hypothetical protein ACR2G4_02445 [Pyrinomonadaceae bacterium]
MRRMRRHRNSISGRVKSKLHLDSRTAKCCRLQSKHKSLASAIRRPALSARAYDRILKSSRPSANVKASDSIRPMNMPEAANSQSLNRTRRT